MQNQALLPPAASGFTAGKFVTRKQLSAHTLLSLRYLAEMTRKGILPHFKIGKSVRYDLAEAEAALRERFHVQPKPKKPHSKGTRAA